MFKLNGDGYTSSDLPNDAGCKYGSAILLVRASNMKFVYLTSTNGWVYVNTYVNGTWAGWQKLVTELSTINVGNNNHAIPANSDINSYTTTGTYVCNDNSIFATLSNRPSGGKAGRLIVAYGTGTAYYYLQTWLDYDGHIYRRYGTSSSWTEWQRIARKSDVDNSSMEIGVRSANTIVVTTSFATNAAFIKYCRDTIRTESTLSSQKAITMFRADGGISSGGFFGTSSFNALCFFSSANYGFIHCWSDKADCGFVHISVNSNNAHIQKPTVTTTTVSLA